MNGFESQNWRETLRVGITVKFSIQSGADIGVSTLLRVQVRMATRVEFKFTVEVALSTGKGWEPDSINQTSPMIRANWVSFSELLNPCFPGTLPLFPA